MSKNIGPDNWAVSMFLLTNITHVAHIPSLLSEQRTFQIPSFRHLYSFCGEMKPFTISECVETSYRE